MGYRKGYLKGSNCNVWRTRCLAISPTIAPTPTPTTQPLLHLHRHQHQAPEGAQRLPGGSENPSGLRNRNRACGEESAVVGLVVSR